MNSSLWHPIVSRQRYPITVFHNYSSMTIGERIKQARADRQMSRTELARVTSIPYPTLAGIENGDQDSTTRLHVIAKALGVRAEWLETGKGAKDAAEPAQHHVSQAVRLDPQMIADTAWALRTAYEAAGRTYNIEEEPERFVEMYLARMQMTEVPTPNNLARLVLKAAGVAQRGDDGGERGDSAATAGSSKKGVSRAGRKA